jgi:hypothetical protein
MPVLSVLSFVWSYVVPVVKDAIAIINKGTYAWIKDRVDDADILELSGFEKRTKVYSDTIGWLENVKKVDTSLYSSAMVYLLIEIAVANLKKKQNKLVK